MKVLVTTVDGQQYPIPLAEYETMTDVEIFNQFLNHFRTNSFWLVSPTEAITFSSVKTVSLVKE